MSDPNENAASDLLKTYRVDGTALYVVGTFDTGVTVFSQQIRALNLAWAAIQSDFVPTLAPNAQLPTSPKINIAIIGAGFAGLAFAAGLISKGADAKITLFEQRDALLPLQQGSDSRWLHPRIYDWPGKQSQASVAMLPVLNWTAARASDVAVQVLSAWKATLAEPRRQCPDLYCNARHLQVHEGAAGSEALKIEWVGEKRNASDGTASKEPSPSAVGGSADFDMVVLTIGFGLERDGALSYWRNETLGQPSLHQPRNTFMVSGQGDGAMIDLLRLRISQYRQDRILHELFSKRPKLLDAIQQLHRGHSINPLKAGLFSDLEALEGHADTGSEFNEVKQDLVRRLRRDTDVILHLKVKNLSQLFDPRTSRISFQNKVLVYFLYKCGGFVPSALHEADLIEQHGIQADRIVRRHGTYRDEQLQRLLSEGLYDAIMIRRGCAKPDPFSQSDKARWPGGYFGFVGKSEDSSQVEDSARTDWRREYLPGPTQLLATTFCASLAGGIHARHGKAKRLRVTLHRAMVFGEEELLQQACDYQGTPSANGDSSGAARTFPSKNGTIGLAYECQQIVRSARGVDPHKLNGAMQSLLLHEASRRMSTEVGFVLAIPLLETGGGGAYTAPSPVVGVIYIDSTMTGFFIDDDELEIIVSMANELLAALQRAERAPMDRIRNVALTELGNSVRKPCPLPTQVHSILELVDGVDPPRTNWPLQFNYDYSEFLPVRESQQP